MIDAKKLIEEYKSAYEAANGCRAPEVIYARGWFRIGRPSHKHRKSGIEQMRDTLLERAKR